MTKNEVILSQLKDYRQVNYLRPLLCYIKSSNANVNFISKYHANLEKKCRFTFLCLSITTYNSICFTILKFGAKSIVNGVNLKRSYLSKI